VVEELNFDKIHIINKYVTIFASGMSIMKVSQEDLEILKQNSYVITTNYPLSLKEPGFSPHMHMWSDYKTSRFMEEYHSDKDKSCIWASRVDAFAPAQKHYNIRYKVDYWFHKNKEGQQKVEYNLRGNFTFYWALQLIRLFVPKAIILVFGLDGYVPEDSRCEDGQPFVKWYDNFIDHDRKDVLFKRREEALERFVDKIEEHFKIDKHYFDNVYNCNLQSRIRYMKKMDYKEVLTI
jgi:hypothetical protein